MAEKLVTTTESENPHDKYAVKVVKDNEVVNHIPRDLWKHFMSALLCRRAVECVIIEKRENKRGNVLEAPCKYIVKGPKYMFINIEHILKYYTGRTNC